MLLNTDDETRFCRFCAWNDCDYGCTCSPNEKVYQCEMYMHYHPDKVKEFEKAMTEWTKEKEKEYIINDTLVVKEVFENNKGKR